jgi:23S rRNA pseudouridine2605 synthase
VASRRAAEALIQSGRVSVNGRVVTALGEKADPQTDVIAVDGERVRVRAPYTIALHKPRGVVTTLRDPEGRPTVSELVADASERVYPIGRLDLQSSGLVLLTNDGQLAAGLQHPRYGVPRVYHVKVQGVPSGEALLRFRRGVRLEDGRAAASRVRVLESRATKTWLEIEMREGRWREVRRMCDALGHPVDKLMRVRVGSVALGALPVGAWRLLDAHELTALYEAVGLSWPGAAGAAKAPARGRRGRGTRPGTRPTPPEKARPRGPHTGAARSRGRRPRSGGPRRSPRRA